MDPTIRMLRACVAVRRTLHFGQAAADLQVSPSSLSDQVTAFERLLGAPLFLRTSRSVVVTDLGHQVLDRAEAVVGQHDELRSWLADLQTPPAGEVRLGFMAGIHGLLVTEVLKEAAERLPGWSVTVQQVGFLSGEAAVRAGRVDVALVAGPIDMGSTDLRGVEILRETKVVMMAAGHRLAGRARLDLVDLAGEPVIAPSAGRSARARHWAVDPRPDGSPVVYGPPARDLEELTQLVAAGLGVAITGSRAMTNSAHLGVVFAELDGVGSTSTWVVSRAADRSPGVLVLEEAAQRVGQMEG